MRRELQSWFVSLLLAGACYSPLIEDGCNLRCGEGGECPATAQCGADGFCHPGAESLPLVHCAERDAGPPDSGLDAGLDGGLDGGLDAGGADAGSDAGQDAGSDAGLPDFCPNLLAPLPSTSCIRHISAGQDHACAVLRDGGVYCWGNGTNHQVTADAGTRNPTPLKVDGLPPMLDAVAGVGVSCASERNVGAWCWGSNLGGTVPMPIVFTPANGQLAAGFRFACERGLDETVWCFGDNDFGQLGYPPSTAQFGARQVLLPDGGPLDEVLEVSTGGSFACARRRGGTIWCWGDNRYAQLGVAPDGGADAGCAGGFPCRYTPQPVGSLSACKLEGNGSSDHACALSYDGGLWCWGRNRFGESGVDPTAGTPHCTNNESCLIAPTLFALPGRPVEVAPGGVHTCARVMGGDVYCWGYNLDGEFGNGGTASSMLAVSLGFKGAMALTAGGNVTCGVLYDGGMFAAYCAGTNGYGQVGNGAVSTADVPVPARVLLPCP